MCIRDRSDEAKRINIKPNPIIKIPIAILYNDDAYLPFNFQCIQNPPTETARVIIKNEFRDWLKTGLKRFATRE